MDDNDPFGLNALQEAFDEAAISKAQVGTLISLSTVVQLVNFQFRGLLNLLDKLMQ